MCGLHKTDCEARLQCRGQVPELPFEFLLTCLVLKVVKLHKCK